MHLTVHFTAWKRSLNVSLQEHLLPLEAHSHHINTGYKSDHGKRALFSHTTLVEQPLWAAAMSVGAWTCLCIKRCIRVTVRRNLANQGVQLQALNLIRVVAHLTWGGGRDTFLMLYRTILGSKLDYGCIVYGTASYTNLRQVDSIHNSGLRPALCTSPVSNMYTQMTKARVRYCWVPSHCGIEDNDIVDQLAKGALTMTDLLKTVHYADLKPLVNSYIKQEVQTKWDELIHGRDLYLVKPTLGPPQNPTAEELKTL